MRGQTFGHTSALMGSESIEPMWFLIGTGEPPSSHGAESHDRKR